MGYFLRNSQNVAKYNFLVQFFFLIFFSWIVFQMTMKCKQNFVAKIHVWASVYVSIFTFGITYIYKNEEFFCKSQNIAVFCCVELSVRWFAYINHWIYKHKRSCEKDDPQTFNNPFRPRFYIHEFVAFMNEYKKLCYLVFM